MDGLEEKTQWRHMADCVDARNSTQNPTLMGSNHKQKAVGDDFFDALHTHDDDALL